MSPVTFRPAVRDRVGLLVGIAGASSAGKTYSAMRLAKGLAGGDRFAVIDTENGRALHYADEFAFDHAVLEPPFRPQAFFDAIMDAQKAGYPVAVVDSMSHEYNGPGGLHDWHDEELDRMAGNEAWKRKALNGSAWNVPKNAHAKFRDDLQREIKMHVILCFRARQAVEFVEVEENGKKKTIIRPIQTQDSFEGWLIETEHKRAPLVFELTCSFVLLPERPGVPRPMKLPGYMRPLVPLDRPLSEETGAELAKWAAGNPKASQAARGRGKGEADQGAQAKLLSDQIVELADASKRDGVFSAIAENRRLHAGDLAAHLVWLTAQLANARQKAAERKDKDLDL